MTESSLEVWYAEAVAEAALTLFTELEAERESTGGHRLTVSLESGSGPGAKDKTSPDDVWSWLISIGLVLRNVRGMHGLHGSTVLIARYVRHETFARISLVTGLREGACQSIAETAVVYFAQELERRGLLAFVESKLPKAHASESCLLDVLMFPELHVTPDVVIGAQASIEYATAAFIEV